MALETTRAILRCLTYPVMVIDRRERIALANAACEELLGPTLEGRHYATIIRQPNLLELIDAGFARGAVGEGRYMSTGQGSEATYRVHAAPFLTDQEGGVVLSFEDTTQTESAARMRRNFVANASHELRTPLTAVLGFIETLKGPARDDPDARERFLGIMENEASRMNRLVGDLLSLTRVESEERQRPSTQVDLVQILKRTIAALQALTDRARVTVHLDCAYDSLDLTGDSDQLTQVFQNLIENAVKYGGQDKEVHVRVTRILREPVLRSGAVQVSVMDQGEGIDERHIPRLTERFYRIDNHRSREMGGTGLGLAIVKHIVNRHRGRLRIASEPQNGSVFNVLLPLDPPELP